MAKKHILGTQQLFDETERVTAIFARGDNAPQQFVPLSRLVPNRFNPRQNYSRETLDELIQSMQVYGFIGALDGRELPDGRVELAYGSRRLLAAKAVNIASVPVFLHQWDDEQMRFIALIENLAREDLTPIDEAYTVGQMRDLLGLTTREIGDRVGRPRSWVQDRLALHSAPDDVREMVISRPDTLRAARFIARLPDARDRRALAEKMLNQDVTTRQVQLAIQQIEAGVSVDDALERAVALSEMPPAAPSAEPVRAEPATEPAAPAHLPANQPASRKPPPPSVEPPDDFARGSSQVFEQEVPFSAAVGPLQRTAASLAGTGQPAAVAAAPGRAPAPDSRWPSTGSPLIILACEAVDSFDPEALPHGEVAAALDWLRQLATKTTALIRALERR